MSDNNDNDDKGKVSDRGGEANSGDKVESRDEGMTGREDANDAKGKSMVDGEGSDGNLDLLEAAPG